MEKFFDIIPPEKLKIKTPSSRYFMNKAPIKIICLLIIIGLNWTGLLAIGGTLANFSDLETSEGNILSAGALDFSLSSGQDNFVPLQKTLNLEPGDEVNRVIHVRNDGTLSFQYTVETEKILGDDDFCNTLELVADLEGGEKYNRGLMGFNLSAMEIIDPPGIDTWHFKVSLPDSSSFQNKICQIKFVFEGWQTNFLNPSSGFFDQEEIESYFASTSSNPGDNPHFISEEPVIDEEIITDNSNQETITEEIPVQEEVTEEETINDNLEEEVNEEIVSDNSDEEISSEETSTDGTINDGSEGGNQEEEITNGDSEEDEISAEEEVTNEETIEEDNIPEIIGTEESTNEEITDNNSNENGSESNSSGDEETLSEPTTIPEDDSSNLPDDDSSNSGVDEEANNNNDSGSTDSGENDST